MQLGVRDVAGIFNVSEKTVYRWIQKRHLPAYRVSEQYRFNRAELLEWATASKVNAPPQLMFEPEMDGKAMPRLDEALDNGGIHYRLNGTDKASVLQAVVQVMRLPEKVDRSFIYQVLLARESLGSTGIGDGIAIPHVRNPIVLHIAQPMISLCFLEHPIDFGALDGRPVEILFTLISPTIRAHLYLLSKIAYALRDSEFRSVISRQGTREEIFTHARRIDEQAHSPDITPSQKTT